MGKYQRYGYDPFGTIAYRNESNQAAWDAWGNGSSWNIGGGGYGGFGGRGLGGILRSVNQVGSIIRGVDRGVNNAGDLGGDVWGLPDHVQGRRDQWGTYRNRNGTVRNYSEMEYDQSRDALARSHSDRRNNYSTYDRDVEPGSVEDFHERTFGDRRRRNFDGEPTGSYHGDDPGMQAYYGAVRKREEAAQQARAKAEEAAQQARINAMTKAGEDPNITAEQAEQLGKEAYLKERDRQMANLPSTAAPAADATQPAPEFKSQGAAVDMTADAYKNPQVTDGQRAAMLINAPSVKDEHGNTLDETGRLMGALQLAINVANNTSPITFENPQEPTKNDLEKEGKFFASVFGVTPDNADLLGKNFAALFAKANQGEVIAAQKKLVEAMHKAMPQLTEKDIQDKLATLSGQGPGAGGVLGGNFLEIFIKWIKGIIEKLKALTPEPDAPATDTSATPPAAGTQPAGATPPTPTTSTAPATPAAPEIPMTPDIEKDFRRQGLKTTPAAIAVAEAWTQQPQDGKLDAGLAKVLKDAKTPTFAPVPQGTVIPQIPKDIQDIYAVLPYDTTTRIGLLNVEEWAGIEKPDGIPDEAAFAAIRAKAKAAGISSPTAVDAPAAPTPAAAAPAAPATGPTP